MKNINKFKRQIDKVNNYKHNDIIESQVSGKKSKMNETKLTHNSYSESRLD